VYNSITIPLSGTVNPKNYHEIAASINKFLKWLSITNGNSFLQPTPIVLNLIIINVIGFPGADGGWQTRCRRICLRYIIRNQNNFSNLTPGSNLHVYAWCDFVICLYLTMCCLYRLFGTMVERAMGSKTVF
jgi:hypothetical protein